MNYESQGICLASNSFVFMCYHLCAWKYLFYCTDIIFEIWTFALWNARLDFEDDNSPCESLQTLLWDCCRAGKFSKVSEITKQRFQFWNVGVWEKLVPEGSAVLVLVESDWLELNVAEYSSSFQVFQTFSMESFQQGNVIYCISHGYVKDLIWHIIIPNISKIHKYCVPYFELGLTSD